MSFDADPDEVPDFAAARDHVLTQLLSFVRVLRRTGVRVPATASIEAARALVETGFDDEDRARTALRSVLISRREDVETFDRLFPEFWRRLTAGFDASTFDPGADVDTDDPDGQLAPLGASPDPDPDDRDVTPPDAASDDEEVDQPDLHRRGLSATGELDDESEGEETETASVYSPGGRSTRVTMDPDALRLGDPVEAAVRRVGRAIAGADGRRWTRAASGDRIDTRRTLRRSFETGGTILDVPEREPKRTAVRVLLLVDVSQSVLDTIDRSFLVRFLQRARADWRRARIFFFDTHVREVTDQFDETTPERAARELERAEAEWGGGTRIGNAITTVREDDPDAVDRTTVVLVVSDGLEVGEIDALEDGMAWLSRRARSVLWLNPLSASPAYEPTCRGMEVSLPYVDGLFAFTGPEDVAEMARQLRLYGPGRRIGYEQDPRRRERAE